jgi:hypothetical protein
MRTRCSSKDPTIFANYAGRGIYVCEQWDDFLLFLTDMGEKPEGMFLERIDNNKGYAPDNCKWASRSEQNNNKRNCRMYTYDGKTQSIAMWAREFHFKRDTLKQRLNSGWSIEKALTTPLMQADAL